MTQIDDSVIRKVTRCMELSKSSNEHEAALALKQMQALMQKHGVSAAHILAADVNEIKEFIGVKKTPASWVLGLHTVIAQAMDCKSIVVSNRVKGVALSFIGVGATAEIANYAFVVMFKKLKKARAEFIKTNLKRYKTANKTKLADAYCDGWVSNVYAKGKNLNPNEEVAEKIKAYTETKIKNYDPSKKASGRERYKRSDQKAMAAAWVGKNDSTDVQLFAAAGHKQQNLIG